MNSDNRSELNSDNRSELGGGFFNSQASDEKAAQAPHPLQPWESLSSKSAQTALTEAMR